MKDATIWWVLAGAAVAVELTTGTFYLLMLAAGLVAGAIAAYIGYSVTAQLVIASIVGGGSVALWSWKRSKQPPNLPVNANRDVHLDIGEPIQVLQWNADGTASVKFRGAQWTAVAAQPDEAQAPGNFRIKEMRGNRLVVEKM